MENKKTKKLKQIRDEIWDLKTSPLYKYRKENNYYPVLGEGSHNAKIMFVGEAPGKNEAEQGKPFCGAAGRILDELLAHIGLDRKKVYVTNIVKDRPPMNRDPEPEEIKLYSSYLDRQIEIIRPKIIAALGRFSMAYIMKRFELEEQLEPISRIHGKVFEAKTSWGTVKVAPMYHPAVAVYNSNSKDILKEDFKILKQYV